VLLIADLPAIDFRRFPSAHRSRRQLRHDGLTSVPLEKQFSTISGPTSMNSTNTQGNECHAQPI
jgi:hypothetical protein